MFGYNFVLTGQVMGKAGVYGLFPCRRSTNNVLQGAQKKFPKCQKSLECPLK